jgi:uncharacterized pyridoxamine 5'-phosphate oxidase family protein
MVKKETTTKSRFVKSFKVFLTKSENADKPLVRLFNDLFLREVKLIV